jgi:phosphoenolpyruvate carboxykinase (ATP)
MKIQYYDNTERLIKSSFEHGVKTNRDGLLYFNTGKFTGRSPKDRYFVFGDYSNKVIDFNREINIGISKKTYNGLFSEVKKSFEGAKTFESKRVLGYHTEHMVSFKLTSTHPHHVLFFNNMTIDVLHLATTFSKCFDNWEILHNPDLKMKGKYEEVKNENFVVINFDEKKILIGGTGYTGEIKKSMFTVLNTLLVDRGVLPMHCSANANTKLGKGVNLFFGLSGTGKTTLSSDPNKFFIGDDEHGWDGNAVFNFEGGCYAKLIDLKEENEPVIWNAIFNKVVENNTSLLENVVVDKKGNFDFTDSSITENIRVSYPLQQIPSNVKVVSTGKGLGVENIFFLSFDAFGVLPPISLLDQEQAVEFFKLGYTSKVAGTEVGVTEPTTVFSTCFGSPFLPRKVEDYTNLFKQKLEENPNVKVWLVNTGFNKDLKRFSIALTRGVINGVIDKKYEENYIDYNGLKIPSKISEYNMDEVFEKPDIERQNKFFEMIKNSSI